MTPSFKLPGFHFTHGHVVEALLMELAPSDYESIAMGLCRMENVLGSLADAIYTLTSKFKKAFDRMVKPAEERAELTEVDRLAREPGSEHCWEWLKGSGW